MTTRLDTSGCKMPPAELATLTMMAEAMYTEIRDSWADYQVKKNVKFPHWEQLTENDKDRWVASARAGYRALAYKAGARQRPVRGR